jgi:PIN domain nuclease of toxin-antitoxin system
MILLLDAHAVVWWLADDVALTAGARAAISDPGNEVFVSAATVWELAIERAKGRIALEPDLTAAIAAAGFSHLPVTSLDAELAAGLPDHHPDPFDRMLVAQAIRLGATVVSRDRALDAYGVSRLET